MSSAPRRVLLVDDEPQILDGLRRMMRPLRSEWELSFATSAPKALEIAESESFDAVVTDMQMPGMDGAELLEKIRVRHPQMIRLILTGQAGKGALLRSVGPTHQVLAKPCDSRVLVEALRRALKLRELLDDSKLRGLTARMSRIPSLPSLYQRIVVELESPRTSAKVLGDLVAQDMGMSAKVLQLVNSAFLGVARKVSDPARAIALLGIDTIRSLVLTLHVFEELRDARRAGLHLDQLFHHSLAVGRLARRIAADSDLSREEASDAYLAGLLHDIGILVLGANAPKEMAAVLETATSKGIAVQKVERQAFGATHAEVGAYLIGLWGLPNTIVEAVAFHHRPDQLTATAVDPGWTTRWGELLVTRAAGAEPAPFAHAVEVVTPDDLRCASEAQLATWGGTVPAILAEVTHDL